MERLVIRVEGSPPDERILVKCGGPGFRTVYSVGRRVPGKTLKEAVTATVEDARARVASQR